MRRYLLDTDDELDTSRRVLDRNSIEYLPCTDVESADVILVKGDLRGIARARGLSQATMRNIREDLFNALRLRRLAL